MSNSNLTRDALSPVTQIQQAVEAAERVLVVSHIDPDGDALGTQLAFGAYLRDLGKDVTLVRDSDIPEKYHFLPGIDQVRPVNELDSGFKPDLGVVLECPNLARAGDLSAWYREGLPIVNIDHHQDSHEYGTVNWIDIKASSVGEMVFEYLTAVGYEIDEKVATCLYTAILTDTGRFRFESARPRTFEVAGQLVNRGAHPRKICDAIYCDMSPQAIRLMAAVLATLELHHDDKVSTLCMTTQMMEQSGAKPADSDGLSDYTLYARGVNRGAFLKEVSPTETKISLRSRDGRDVAKVAAQFGGGGHSGAAGCSVSLPLDQAKAKIVEMLKQEYLIGG